MAWKVQSENIEKDPWPQSQNNDKSMALNFLIITQKTYYGSQKVYDIHITQVSEHPASSMIDYLYQECEIVGSIYGHILAVYTCTVNLSKYLAGI